MEWDVKLTRASKRYGTLQVCVPAPVGRQLLELGLNRARVSLTEEGILLVPYRGNEKTRGATVDLPAWADGDVG